MDWNRYRNCTKERQELGVTASTQGTRECDTVNERTKRGVFGEGGAEWKMATKSMHNDVLLDSEECHE